MKPLPTADSHLKYQRASFKAAKRVTVAAEAGDRSVRAWGGVVRHKQASRQPLRKQ